MQILGKFFAVENGANERMTVRPVVGISVGRRLTDVASFVLFTGRIPKIQQSRHIVAIGVFGNEIGMPKIESAIDDGNDDAFSGVFTDAARCNSIWLFDAAGCFLTARFTRDGRQEWIARHIEPQQSWKAGNCVFDFRIDDKIVQIFIEFCGGKDISKFIDSSDQMGAIDVEFITGLSIFKFQFEHKPCAGFEIRRAHRVNRFLAE